MSEATPRPQIAPMRTTPKAGPSSWKHLDRHLALATRATAELADDEVLRCAIDQCVDEVQADDWPIELFVTQLREVLDAAWAKFESGPISPKINRRDYDRLALELLD